MNYANFHISYGPGGKKKSKPRMSALQLVALAIRKIEAAEKTIRLAYYRSHVSFDIGPPIYQLNAAKLTIKEMAQAERHKMYEDWEGEFDGRKRKRKQKNARGVGGR